MQQFIEEMPAEQEVRQHYTARARALQEQIGDLHRRKVTAYAPSSLALIEQQIQTLQAEVQQLDEAEAARIAAL